DPMAHRAFVGNTGASRAGRRRALRGARRARDIPMIAHHALAALSIALCGCSAIVGIGDLPKPAGTNGTPGDNGNPGGSDASRPLLGQWKLPPGSTTHNCNGSTQTTDDAFTLTITEGSGGNVFLTSPPCDFEASVGGSTATLFAGQECTVSTAQGDITEIL